MLQNATSLRKSAPRPPNSSDEHVSRTAPATENASLQILFKCPAPAIVLEMLQNPTLLLPFDTVHNPLRLPGKTTSERPKVLRVLRTRQFFTLDFEMCIAPQRRSLFRHRNFQKWSEHGVLCTFWLRNVLRATTECTFSTSQLPKVVWAWCVLYILTWKCDSRHNGVQLFISHLASWLRARCFSEPTCRPSGATNHWKNVVFCDFPTFSRTWIFFLLRFSLFWSSFFSSLLWLFPSLLLICPYCRKFEKF